MRDSRRDGTNNTAMNYITLDTETGGLYPSINALLSIGACCTWSPDTFQVYITPESQPNKYVDPRSLAKNGYSAAVWAGHGAVSLDEAMLQFLAWVAVKKGERHRAKLVCHNLGFDRGFLGEAELQTGREIPHRHDWLCSQMLFGQLMDKGLIESGSSSLDRLGQLSGWHGERTSAHNALQDAEITRHGLLWLLEIEKGPEDRIRQLYIDSLRDRKRLEALILKAAETLDITASFDDFASIALELKTEARHLLCGAVNDIPEAEGRAA